MNKFGAKKVACMLLMLILILFSIIFVPQGVVKADTTEPVTKPTAPTEEQLGAVVSIQSGVTDSLLYYALTQIYKSYYGVNLPNGELRKNMFSGMDFSYFDGVLDLGGGGVSSGGINDITGLELLNFSNCINLTKVDLSDNNLNTVTDTNLRSLGELDTIVELDISDNNISVLNLSCLENLERLDASNNKISTADLKNIKAKNKEAFVNLTNNTIKDANHISFLREGVLDYNINLYILNSLATNTYVGNSRIKLHTGLSGIKDDGNYTYGDEIIYSKLTDISFLNLGVDDFVINLANYEDGTLVGNAILNSTAPATTNLLSALDYGKYMIYFSSVGGASLSGECSALVDKYNAYVVNYIPATPTLKATIGDNSANFKSGDIVKENITFTFSSIDNDAEFYYKLGKNDWVKATSVEISKGNTDSLVVKTIVDGIESETLILTFGKDTSFGLDDLLSIGLVVLGLLVLFFVMIPLVKYFISKPIVLNKSKNKKNKDK